MSTNTLDLYYEAQRCYADMLTLRATSRSPKAIQAGFDRWERAYANFLRSTGEDPREAHALLREMLVEAHTHHGQLRKVRR